MLQMVQRLIGEDIELHWNPGADLWSVKMDPSQIDQILANLCVNSRDAIAGVGEVIISTDNVTFEDVHFLQKPFSTETLAEEVREVLDGRLPLANRTED